MIVPESHALLPKAYGVSVGGFSGIKDLHRHSAAFSGIERALEGRFCATACATPSITEIEQRQADIWLALCWMVIEARSLCLVLVALLLT
jgi:hypothetical protein